LTAPLSAALIAIPAVGQSIMISAGSVFSDSWLLRGGDMADHQPFAGAIRPAEAVDVLCIVGRSADAGPDRGSDVWFWKIHRG